MYLIQIFSISQLSIASIFLYHKMLLKDLPIIDFSQFYLFWLYNLPYSLCIISLISFIYVYLHLFMCFKLLLEKLIK